MDGVHDMGGMHGFGAVVTEDGELTHHESWEVRAQVLSLFGGATRGRIEALGPARYLATDYYPRWLLAGQDALAERGVAELSEIEAWIDRLRADPDDLPVSSDPEAAAAFVPRMRPHRHGAVEGARFAVGERVVVRRMRPEAHHRCPRYLRGAAGTIEKVLGNDPVPGRPSGESETCYTVSFSSIDLFGDQRATGEEPYRVYVDLWQRYLEQA